MLAITRSVPPQRRQVSMAMANTRLSRYARGATQLQYDG